jgi:Domain of unknown function (DUF4281)
MSPDPHVLFQFTGPLAILGWLALVLSPFAPRAADALAALAIPALLSVAYTALILVHWADAPGGFDSLANVMALFTNPAGAWITRIARAEGINHLLILPCMVLTFLFGPAGFLAFTALRASLAARARMIGASA